MPCRLELMRDGKPYPRSSCAVHGFLAAARGECPPLPESADLREEELTALREALGLLSTQAPNVVMNPDDPVAMAQEIVKHLDGQRAKVRRLQRKALNLGLDWGEDVEDRGPRHVVNKVAIRYALEEWRSAHPGSGLAMMPREVIEALQQAEIARLEGFGRKECSHPTGHYNPAGDEVCSHCGEVVVWGRRPQPTTCERCEDWADSYRRVMAEACSPDERHCTCVPYLRAEIERLTPVEPVPAMWEGKARAGPDPIADLKARVGELELHDRPCLFDVKVAKDQDAEIVRCSCGCGRWMQSGGPSLARK